MTHYNLLKLKPGADAGAIFDILMIMQIDRPEQLGTYLQHPKHVALAQGMKDSIADRMSFDAE